MLPNPFAERIFKLRYLWMFLPAVMLLEPFFFSIAYFLFDLIGFDMEPLESLRINFSYRYNNVWHMGQILAIPYVLGASALFVQLQKMLKPDVKAYSFLPFRPGKAAAFLEEVFTGVNRAAFKKKDAQFWVTLFIISQPVYLMFIVFPVKQMIFNSGYVLSSILISNLVYFSMVFSWLIVVWQLLRKAVDVDVVNKPVSIQSADETTLKIVANQIESLRRNSLKAIQYQIFGVVLLFFSIQDHFNLFSLYESLIEFLNAIDIWGKLPFFIEVFLSLIVFYYVHRLMVLGEVLHVPNSKWTRWNYVLYFMPGLSFFWRISALFVAQNRWNNAIRQGEFSRQLYWPEVSIVGFIVFWFGFSYYNFFYLKEVLVFAKLDFIVGTLSEYARIYTSISSLLVYGFLMFLVIITDIISQQCTEAADELSESYGFEEEKVIA